MILDNRCRFAADFIVAYSPTEGNWRTAGWIKMDAYERSYVVIDNSRLKHLDTAGAFAYAERRNGEYLQGKGSQTIGFRGKNYLVVSVDRFIRGSAVEFRVEC